MKYKDETEVTAGDIIRFFWVTRMEEDIVDLIDGEFRTKRLGLSVRYLLEGDYALNGKYTEIIK